MAAKKKKKKQNSRVRKVVLIVLVALIAAILAVIGWAALNASILHVRHAEVYIEDLPAGFEGRTILYVSDIDLCGLNTPAKAAAAFKRLQDLKPDMLILGGDYTSPSLFDVLNRSSDNQVDSDNLSARSDFFHYISDFSAPLGKYAIASPEDPDITLLAQQMTASGIQPLFDAMTMISCNGDHIWLAGLNSVGTVPDASAISHGECVIGVASTPALFPSMMIVESRDGGHLYDLALAGHTHGGQIRLFGRNVIELSFQEQQYLYGWNRETGVPMLTTSGLGCEGVNLRLGSQAEVWMIKLTGIAVDEN